MASNLVIVESPAKAKTIQKYLGKDYIVTSSFGHVRDLPKKDMSIDIEGDFSPKYVVSSDKKKKVTELKKAVKEVSTVWLATDEDREGEAIAWHLSEVLKLQPEQTKRIVFHEITKTAITGAIEAPRSIDKHLVDAQQARRVLDRLVGYELSPVLWKKVRPGLSAGRVQSVAVRLIVEREREITDHKPTITYKVTAHLMTNGNEAVVASAATTFKNSSEATAFLEKLKSAKLKIQKIEQSAGTRKPGPPFTTSSLQQEAARKLGFSVKQTMTLAQRLYEAGHITYMRTDSLSLSAQSLAAAKTTITKEYGSQYHKERHFKTKSQGAQEAHEAIRPTNPAQSKAGADPKQSKLYELIRGRFLASQMTPVKTKRTTAIIGDSEVELVAKGEIVDFPGWLKVYKDSSLKDKLLPELNEGDPMQLTEAEAVESFSRAPARYSEATLVKQLEEMGIGRPSTFAPTISTIQDRGYVEKGQAPETVRKQTTIKLKDGEITTLTEEKTVGGEQRKLLPTDTALVVTDFLTKHFPEIVDYDFTANVEGDFDKIAAGAKQWNTMIRTFYKGFHETVEKAEKVSRKEAAQARTLGTDPKTKKPVTARFGRYGPMLQIGDAEDEDKPQFAPMPKGETLSSVTLEQALKMFELPRTLGKDGDSEIRANIGRYGPYVQRDRTFASIPKDEDVFSIDLSRAISLLNEQQAKKQKSILQDFGDGLQVKTGRYGPYVTNGTVNAKIPKGDDPESLTKEAAESLIKKKTQA